MTEPKTITRRAALTISGVGMTAMALAACAPGGETSTPDGAAPETTAPQQEASGGTTEQSDQAASGAEVAKLADIPVGGSIDATLD
ncbi:MAG: hypothetical protein ABWX82_13610, partial [Leifsonia sp.]